MTYRSYEVLQNRLQELSNTGEYESARKLAEENLKRFPEFTHLLSLWMVGMSARLRQYPQAMAAMEHILDTGFWYDENMLRSSSSLKAVWDHPDFQELLSRNRTSRDSDPLEEHSLVVIRRDEDCQPGSPGCPLLIGLHDNSSTASATLEMWREAATAGWLVAALQSSQALWKGAYIWNDPEQAALDLRDHFQLLADRYAIDPRRVILAGVGRGAEMAALLALRGVMFVQGFIAIHPIGPLTNHPENWEPILLEPRTFNPRAYLFIDPLSEQTAQENLRLLIDLLNESGITADFCDQAKHTNDLSGFNKSLMHAIEFITSP